MQKVAARVLIAAVLGLASTTMASGPIEFELTADYFGKYIWRGQNLSDDPVLQPGLSASYGGLTAGIWANMDTTPINKTSGDFSEVDYSLGYSGTFPGLEGVGYSLGLIYYHFPGTAVKDTTEFYWGFNFDLPLSPSVTLYHDLDEAEGTYMSFEVGHTIERAFELAQDVPVAVDIGAGFGYGSASYNKYYWGENQAKGQDLSLSVGLPFELGPVTVTPSLNYVTLLSSGIRKTDAYDTSSDYFFAGIGLAFTF
jgi:uncharacterized protein (TIGR02001 family)